MQLNSPLSKCYAGAFASSESKIIDEKDQSDATVSHNHFLSTFSANRMVPSEYGHTDKPMFESAVHERAKILWGSFHVAGSRYQTINKCAISAFNSGKF
jgi:hypothetical protein